MMISSSPISIPASEPIAISRGHNNDLECSSHSHSISPDDGERRCEASGLSALLGNADSMGELEVGSLPMHLQRPGRGRIQRRQQHGLSNSFSRPNTNRRFAGAMSLPQPNAPFLSSRGGPKDKLSSIPDFTLPESVVSASPKSLSSVQYGSLRESRNHFDRYLGMEEKSGMATTTHESMWSNSLPAYSRSYMGGPVGSLPPQSGANSHPLDGIEAITEGCTGITLGNGLNDTHRAGGLSTIFGSGADFNEESAGAGVDAGAISESAPLSSSLTAMDLLTRIKGSRVMLQTTSPTEGHFPQPNELQQPHESFTHHEQTQNEVEDTNGYTIDEQYDNDDTFEAFDFELDG